MPHLRDAECVDLHSLGAGPRTLGALALALQCAPPDARAGRVVRAERARVLVRAAGSPDPVPARHAGVVAVGDWVVLITRPEPRVHDVVARGGVFARQAAGRATAEQVLASGVDDALVLTSITSAVSARRLARFVTLAHDGGITPRIVLAKADLLEPGARITQLQAARAAVPGVAVHVVSAFTGEGLSDVAALAGPGRTLALLGGSGAGKSSLLNALAGRPVAATGEVRHVDGKGRHTTAWRELVELPGGGAVIDTPGLRGLALSVDRGGLDATFADVVELAVDCRFGDCAHTGEPGCAVRSAVEAGVLDPERLSAHRKLSAESAWIERRQDARLRREYRRQWAAKSRDGRGRARP